MKNTDFKRPAARQLPSGSWRCRVRVDGKDISIVKPTRKEAEAEAMAVKYGIIEAANRKTSKNITLREAVRSYIADKEDFCSPSTIDGYEKHARNNFQSLMEKNIFTITDQQWQQAIKAEHRRGCSPKYIKNAWGFFAAVLEYSGANRPDINLYPSVEYERAWLTPDEIDKFVDAIKGKKAEIPALLCLSSLRRSEMLAVDWENIDLENNAIYVRGAVVKGKNGLVEKPQNKTDKSRRSVPMIEPLREALELVPPENRIGKVATLSGGAILRNVQNICQEANITVVDLHGLRHSFASLCYHLQIPEMITAEIGGWSDLSTVHKIYTHIAQKDIAKRSEQLQAYFRKNGHENDHD